MEILGEEIMERGKESQTKVTDIFSEDKNFYALVEIEPMVDKLIEVHKRFERRYPELIESITVKGDEFKELEEAIEHDIGYWEENATYGEMTDSPAYHLVRKSTTRATEVLKSVREFQEGELGLIKELQTFSNTIEGILDNIASIVARQDNRIKFYEEERKVFLSLTKEKPPTP
jgi:hypothetical protein